ncbi:MAG: hypothetical protein AVDCRST_MAG73-3651, partial [uncultured Thermomicrobiales bacterium]
GQPARSRSRRSHRSLVRAEAPTPPRLPVLVHHGHEGPTVVPGRLPLHRRLRRIGASRAPGRSRAALHRRFAAHRARHPQPVHHLYLHRDGAVAGCAPSRAQGRVPRPHHPGRAGRLQRGDRGEDHPPHPARAFQPGVHLPRPVRDQPRLGDDRGGGGDRRPGNLPQLPDDGPQPRRAAQRTGRPHRRAGVADEPGLGVGGVARPDLRATPRAVGGAGVQEGPDAGRAPGAPVHRAPAGQGLPPRQRPDRDDQLPRRPGLLPNLRRPQRDRRQDRGQHLRPPPAPGDGSPAPRRGRSDRDPAPYLDGM